jgi:Uma2 family endonuclease
MAIRQRRLTLEEFLHLPEAEPELEYIDGVVTQKVPPKFRHSTLQSIFVMLVNQRVGSVRQAYAFPELRTTFAGASVVPDVSIYRWHRIPVDAGGEVVEDALEPPDVAIEILSPGQSLRSGQTRCRWYVEHGVVVAILVAPGQRTVTLFRDEVPPQVLRGADHIDLDDVVPGFALTVEDLFGALHFG